jgi:protoporphyrinogen oxidase
MPNTPKAIVMGAGPAGLTAAIELIKINVQPIIIEKASHVGGLAKTINHNGNGIDPGGHRFFSKSELVVEWWLNFLPLEGQSPKFPSLSLDQSHIDAADFQTWFAKKEMLLRPRKSRIQYKGRLFDHPIQPTLDTLMKLGPINSLVIGMSYLYRYFFPIVPEKSLEDFFINHFGRQLYRTFFKSYTEKVWGIECGQMSASWGAQRIRDLSIKKIIVETLGIKKRDPSSNSKKPDVISLSDNFLYPAFGPGQLWEEVAARILEKGGELHLNCDVDRIKADGDRIAGVDVTNGVSKATRSFAGDYFFSSMPMKNLFRCFDHPVPPSIKEISEGLIYRNLITVWLLLDRLDIRADRQIQPGSVITDNWIYLQEAGLVAGRLQIYNNWSPGLVKDPATISIGLEYFCDPTSAMWNSSDQSMIALAISELKQLGTMQDQSLSDSRVVRVPDAYPVYAGTHARLAELRSFVDQFENLYLIGRNGMHKYNNQDHVMLSAMIAVKNIAAGRKDKSNIWAVNTDPDYHEEKTS